MEIQFQIIFLFLLGPDQLNGSSTECCKCSFRDCQDYLENGNITSAIYIVTPVGMNSEVQVYCDMTTDGGGWVVFQRRVDNSVDFYRNWNEYEHGFGNPSHEHWLGLLNLKRILSQGHYELRIDLEDWNNETRYATYNAFDITGPESNYKLKVAGYFGTAGDSLYTHNGQMFSTKDEDNDSHDSEHCAKVHHGAWWYKKCHVSNLNGKYYSSSQSRDKDNIHWRTWLKDGEVDNYPLKKTEMKIRRA